MGSNLTEDMGPESSLRGMFSCQERETSYATSSLKTLYEALGLEDKGGHGFSLSALKIK